MKAFPFELEYYVAESGQIPFKEWLDGLKDVSGRAKIRVRLDRVRMGNLGDNRSVGGSIYELKVEYGPGYRIYFTREDARIILLLLGSDKSSQVKDIAKARVFREDYLRRRKHG